MYACAGVVVLMDDEVMTVSIKSGPVESDGWKALGSPVVFVWTLSRDDF